MTGPESQDQPYFNDLPEASDGTDGLYSDVLDSDADADMLNWESVDTGDDESDEPYDVSLPVYDTSLTNVMPDHGLSVRPQIDEAGMSLVVREDRGTYTTIEKAAGAGITAVSHEIDGLQDQLNRAEQAQDPEEASALREIIALKQGAVEEIREKVIFEMRNTSAAEEGGLVLGPGATTVVMEGLRAMRQHAATAPAGSLDATDGHRAEAFIDDIIRAGWAENQNP